MILCAHGFGLCLLSEVIMFRLLSFEGVLAVCCSSLLGGFKCTIVILPGIAIGGGGGGIYPL